jgi:hypothetical protein
MSEPVTTAALVLAAAAALAASIICTRYAWDRRANPNYRVARWARAFAAVAGLPATLLSVPALADRLDLLVGLDDTAMLCSHLCTVMCCTGLQLMMVDWVYTSRYLLGGVLTRIAAALAVSGLLIVQFHQVNHAKFDFTTAYAASHRVTTYLLTFLLFVAYSAIEGTALCTGMALASFRQGRRRSGAAEAMVALGSAFAFSYAALKITYLASFHLGGPTPKAEAAITSPLIALGAAFILAGLSAMLVGKQVNRAEAALPTVGAGAS